MHIENRPAESDVDPQLIAMFREWLREVPDFPQPGIRFKDISPVLARPGALSRCVATFEPIVRKLEPDILLAVDARGFLIGGALADRLGCGLVMIRKPGKLPPPVANFEYANEYGSGRFEVTPGIIPPDSRCLIVDDLLATGGTARATADFAKSAGAAVAGYAFLVELCFLDGRRHLSDAPVVTLFKC